MSEFDHLARPIKISPETLKNRIVHAAVLTRLVEAQQPSDAFLRYHENRARGGATMIVSEAVNALRGQGGRPDYLNVHNDDGNPGLNRLAERVRAHDCELLAQLQDRAPGNYSPVRVDSAYGLRALPDDLSRAVPHALATRSDRAYRARPAGPPSRRRRGRFVTTTRRRRAKWKSAGR